MPGGLKKDVTVLDCTLRDGGYYNDWDFSLPLVRDLLLGLDRAGVDIVELGYRSTAATGFFGLFKYCNEKLMRPLLPSEPRAHYAFMIDSKEFAKDADTVDAAALRAVVPPASSSIFKWCRVATHPSGILAARQQTDLLKELGYDVALNVMGISELQDSSLRDVVSQVDPRLIDVLYLADSYGSLTPDGTLSKLKVIRSAYSGRIGVHMHENQGLALANTSAAIEDGVDFVDATVAGMGRGAGNLRLEQLLLSMFFRSGRTDLHPAALLPALREHFLPLQAKHGWGWDFSYMLSGLVGIHPTYCQELKTGSRYELEEVVAILESIPAGKRAKYDEDELLAAVERSADRKRGVEGEISVSTAYQARESETVLVVANGPHVHRHEEALHRFIERHRPLVIECNDVGVLDGVARTTVVMNRVRLDELASRSSQTTVHRQLVTGLSSAPSSLSNLALTRVHYTLGAGAFAVNGTDIVLPGYVVGMLAVALALQSKPGEIYLAGFDGFEDPTRRAEQGEMEMFWELLRRSDAARGIRVTSILPTTYSLPVRSVYSLI